MPKRNLRPIYPHLGFMIRTNKVLANGVELLYCSERQTSIGCTAKGHRDDNGVITLLKPHTGHVENDGLVEAKQARLELKELASSTKLPPRDVLHETRMKYGAAALVMAGSSSSLERYIGRARQGDRCLDTEAVDAAKPIFQGKMCLDNDQEPFLLFDDTLTQTGGRHAAFGNKLSLEVLESSEIFLTDGTFSVAQAPFVQLWVLHAKFDDATIPVVNVLMSSRSNADYSFVLEKLKAMMPNWNPSDFFGDLELGQSKAVSDAFPGIRTNYCYFHLLQAWYRRMKKHNLGTLTTHGNQLYQFWSLLRCLPYADPAKVEQDFDLLVGRMPTPLTPDMTNFVNYLRRYYVGPRPSLMFPPSSWNVSDRTIRNLPRTTNSVEAHHRNLERCVRDTNGRTTPLLSELLKCLRQEASKLKFDKEALDVDPTYKISSRRKLKDISKDKRILAVVQNTSATGAPLTGLAYLKAIRAAKKYI
ncbi:hypothetical protein B9Z55_026428 [Caenorhabditis nigoni]|uniref:MULE transposase domain-containing protein n=2 Tax=Caenorhabditis nigoni TaxID=1611254 RepID=A0A2G5T2Q2_9PELO|nr:hypothetical protein B9Z55_026428 [Caenorhabditis nigoni]